MFWKKIQKMHLSQKRFERAKRLKFGTFLNISKVSKILKNLKPHKLALISETVRDRAKRMKFGKHMFCLDVHRKTSFNISKILKISKFKKNIFKNTKLYYYGNALFCTQAQKQVDNAKHTWQSLSLI